VILSDDDARLLEYYVQRGHGPWNLSLDAAWLDYELRRYVGDQLRMAFGGGGIAGTGDEFGHRARPGIRETGDELGHRACPGIGGTGDELRTAFGETLAACGHRARPSIAETCDRVARGRPRRVCNVGIGVGLWDDWLGYVIAGEITSIDRDRDICEVFELRQCRERHPHPARVICGDVFDRALTGDAFDVITCIGSTLHESGAPEELREVLTASLAPTGRLIVAEVRETVGMPGVALTCTSTGRDGRPMDQS
jgi:hypothetical protein